MPLQLTHVERCIISALVYFVCFLLEIGGCIVLYQVISSDCVWGRENSTRIFFALICVVVPILPDIFYCIMGILISDPFYAPLGGCYNIAMGCFCILSAIFAFVSYTGCGNPAQLQAVVAGVLSLLAGIIHLVFILFVKENLDEGEVLFRKTF